MNEPKPFPLLLVALADTARRLQVLNDLPHHGWRVLTVGTAEELTGLLVQHMPDAIVVDATLATAAGQFHFLRLPTLALVDPADPAATLRLLRENGVASCLPLPLDSEILVAALDALQRLTRPDSEEVQREIAPRGGEAEGTWTLFPTTWKLAPPVGPPIQLNQAETSFLAALADNPGQPVSRKEMITQLGHTSDYFDSRRLDTLVSRLRTKVNKDSPVSLPVRSIHSVGYAFVAPIALDA